MLWFVIFPGRDPAAPLPAWWQRLLRLHHHHVLAARAEGDSTLVVDMLGRRLDITLHPQPIGEHIAGWLRKPGTWVLAIMGHTNTGPQLHGPMTCVTVVQALLGVR